ncbi:MAG TPA: GNAT family N-acetyltransferase [Candidatus Acidoferrales bacterium]|nr:GNAT family N-acetyltransferase [Candidatus Acidoferrales bacterium]
MISAPIEIRHCATLAEYQECERLERLTWGDELTVPSGLFFIARNTGGQALGAFEGEKLVGFTLALAGVRAMRAPASRAGEPLGRKECRALQPFLHSHMTAVLPEYRDRGVGRRLKLFQRQDALKRGIRLIEWTFDPLEPKNAHFNLVRLGAIARRLIPNCYGITTSPLHSGMPTDRLVAEWWLDSERVKSVLADNPSPSKTATARISLPVNLAEIKTSDREAAIRIQSAAREQFEGWFEKKYAATAIETRAGKTDYLLESLASAAGLSAIEDWEE